MRGWARTVCMIGIGLLITWGFGVIGYHTPDRFVMAVVGTTGAMIVSGCVLEALESLTDPPAPATARDAGEG